MLASYDVVKLCPDRDSLSRQDEIGDTGLAALSGNIRTLEDQIAVFEGSGFAEAFEGHSCCRGVTTIIAIETA